MDSILVAMNQFIVCIVECVFPLVAPPRRALSTNVYSELYISVWEVSWNLHWQPEQVSRNLLDRNIHLGVRSLRAHGTQPRRENFALPSIYSCIFARTVQHTRDAQRRRLSRNKRRGRRRGRKAKEANNLQDRVSSGYKCDCNNCAAPKHFQSVYNTFS